MFWILCQRFPDDSLKTLGVFETEDQAKQAAVDGRYAAVPVKPNTLYSDLISIGAIGISIFSKQGDTTRLGDLEAKADQILSEIVDIRGRIAQAQTFAQTTKDRLDSIEVRLDAFEDANPNR